MTQQNNPHVSEGGGVSASRVELRCIGQDTPRTVLGGVGIHCSALAVHENFYVFVSAVVLPLDDRNLVTLTIIKENDVVNFVALGVNTDEMITAKHFQIRLSAHCTFVWSSVTRQKTSPTNGNSTEIGS